MGEIVWFVGLLWEVILFNFNVINKLCLKQAVKAFGHISFKESRRILCDFAGDFDPFSLVKISVTRIWK